MLDELAVRIGLRLKEKRKAVGLTHAVLAEAIGRSENLISKIECGIALPSLNSLTRIAALLGVDVSYFFIAEPSFEAKEDTKEMALVTLYRKLEPDQQEAFYEFIAANYPIFRKMRFS